MRASNSNLAANDHTDSSDFILPPEIPIDKAHSLDQLTARFRNVKDGLPELIKNAKDQYARLGIVDRQKRQIVVLANTESHRMGVVDFAGARSEEFDGWVTWSSREAGRTELSSDIEAGHGNGGKAFMVRGCLDRAYMESCRDRKRTRMGFKNQRAADKYKPGYAIENGVKIEDVDEPNPKMRLDRFLSQFGLNTAKLPQHALMAFDDRHAFTGVMLADVTEWNSRRKGKVKNLAESLPSIIAGHGQAALTIETCEVWVIVDGKLMTNEPIAPMVLEPYPGFEQPRSYPIPDVLSDPEGGDSVDMVAGTAGERYLRLSTSLKQMQMSEELRARNTIRLWNERNNVGNWPLQSLGVPITSVSFIYGEIRCPALVGENLAGAERMHMNETPLTRSLQAWTREKVRALAEELHRAMMAENRPRDREKAKTALHSLRDLMREFLDPDASGEDANDDDSTTGQTGEKGKGRKRRRKYQIYGERVDQIILEMGRAEIVLVEGTSVPLQSKCLEQQVDGKTKPVRVTCLKLHADTPHLVASRSGDRVEAKNSGRTTIWLTSEDGSITSNKVQCEIIAAVGAVIGVPEDVLLQGQRVKIPVTFQTANGPRDDALIDGSIDEPGMGLFGRSGRFTAGYKEGQATIRVRFSANPSHQSAAVAQIGTDRIQTNEGSQGSDIPEILLCGEPAPGTEELPDAQRTVAGGEEMPTIIEDPMYPSVVWINPTSREAMRVRGGRGGPTGIGSISSKTFMHFVALKCFDVLKRLHVRQAIRGQSVTEFQFTNAAANAEMECANFIDAAWELSDDLTSRAEVVGVETE